MLAITGNKVSQSSCYVPHLIVVVEVFIFTPFNDDPKMSSYFTRQGPFSIPFSAAGGTIQTQGGSQNS